ncbi:MAG: PCMD domain-containing protein [Bacteroidales bacterium]|nr:PCMD domain-containing protein [Bacteroidales bacterium]
MKYLILILIPLYFLLFSSCKKETPPVDDNEDDDNITQPLPTNVNDGDFENWEAFTSGNNTYEEPKSGWWATLNVLSNLGAPKTAIKTSDAHTGKYAAKLVTSQWGELTLPGILLSGVFDFNAPNMIIEGKPFTDKPLTFKGFYKYTSVNGDSGAIYANITKYDFQAVKRDTIAEARFPVYNTISTYTPFEVDLNYLMTDVTPDSLSIVFASSADGGNFNGSIGSTLFIDDVSLILQSKKKLKLL